MASSTTEAMGSTTTYKDRVARGAALLDKSMPGWHRNIDLDALELSSCTDCVCGQLAYAAGSVVIDREIAECEENAWWSFRKFIGRRLRRRGEKELAAELVDKPSNFGFSAKREHFDSLDREWRKVIEARLRGEAA